MRVLSVQQPFAQLIVRGAKAWEVRQWPTGYRGRIAIHASSAVPSKQVMIDTERHDQMRWLFADQGWYDRGDLIRLPRSAVIGTVELVDVVRGGAWRDAPSQHGGFAADYFVWKLADAIEIEPVEIKGQHKLWTLPEEVARAVADGEARARARISARSLADPGDLPFEGELEGITVAEYERMSPAEYDRRCREQEDRLSDVDFDHRDALEEDHSWERAKRKTADRPPRIVPVPEPRPIADRDEETPAERHGRPLVRKEVDALVARTMAPYLAQHTVRVSGSRAEVRVDHRVPELARVFAGMFAGREWVAIAELEGAIRASLWVRGDSECVRGGAELGDHVDDDDDDDDDGEDDESFDDRYPDPYRDFSGQEEIEAQGRYVRLPDGSTAEVKDFADLPPKPRKP